MHEVTECQRDVWGHIPFTRGGSSTGVQGALTSPSDILPRTIPRCKWALISSSSGTRPSVLTGGGVGGNGGCLGVLLGIFHAETLRGKKAHGAHMRLSQLTCLLSDFFSNSNHFMEILAEENARCAFYHAMLLPAAVNLVYVKGL